MKTILKAFFLLVALTLAVPVFAQTDFEATKARAEAGDAEAQVALGLMYMNGRGVAQNNSEAVKWYRLAAEQGKVGVQWLLGWMYEDGIFVAQNYQESLRWYRLAADQGDSDSYLALGIMYENGTGVPKSDQEALKWYELAAAKGVVEATRRRTSILAKVQLAAEQETQMLSYETKCLSFGFNRDTPEMANCKFELYKLENTATATVGDLYDSYPAPSNQNSDAALQLLNQGLQIMNDTLNRPRQSAPQQRTVNCTKFGDFSRKIYTFNMACPMGYVQSF
jgi:TPR repeat protein